MSVEEERTETSDSFVRAPPIVEIALYSGDNAGMRNEEHQTSGRAEDVTEIRSVPAGGSDEEDVSSNGPEKEVSTILRQVHSEHPSKALPVVQSG